VVSKDNVVIVAIGTIVITIIGALLSDVFSPTAENIKDIFSSPPNTTISTAMTFDSFKNKVSKNVNPNDTIPSRGIEFTFSSSGATVFECSFDGSPYEECLSPKHYGNLQTEQGHTFKVRAKGLLGNVEKEPATFPFISVTSSSVTGIIKNSTSALTNATIQMDPEITNVNTTTDQKGRFYFTRIGEGQHLLHIIPDYRSDVGANYNQSFFVPPGAPKIDDLDWNLSDLITDIPDPKIEVKESEQNQNSSQFEAANNTKAKNYFVNLMQQSEPTGKGDNRSFTKVWLNTSEATLSKVDNVTYYLHPTFTPDKVTIFTPENKFELSFTNWGIFLLRAQVYFNDGAIKYVELHPEEWK